MEFGEDDKPCSVPDNSLPARICGNCRFFCRADGQMACSNNPLIILLMCGPTPVTFNGTCNRFQYHKKYRTR